MITLAYLPTLLSYKGCRDYYNIPTKSAEFIIGTPSYRKLVHSKVVKIPLKINWKIPFENQIRKSDLEI